MIFSKVGVAMDDDELEQFLKLAEHIKCEIEQEHTPTLFGPDKMADLAIQNRELGQLAQDPITVNFSELREEQRTIVGIHDIFGKMYNELGFDQVLKPSRHGQSASDILRHIVMARIANPVSKRVSVNNLEVDFGVNLNLQKVYRMMDKLDEDACERVQNSAYQTVAELFGGKVDVIFFDATTLYFESFIEDELKQNGFSKDHKFGQSQVLLALMVTEHGLPIGYEAFPGSTYDGHTLIPMLKSIKKRYDLGKVVFVADSGLLSTKNLQAMDDVGFQYIVGARLRNMKSDIQKQILDRENYTSFGEQEDTLKLASFELE